MHRLYSIASLPAGRLFACGLPALIAAVTAIACGSNAEHGTPTTTGTGTGTGPGTSSGSSSTGTQTSGGMGFRNFGSDSGEALGASGDAAVSCGDGGCTCLRIASIGHPGIWGACGEGGADGTSALVSWLASQSTAAVDTYATTKPTLTADFLAPYDVIILQWLRDVSATGRDGALWQFSPAEVSALAAWVNAGGGLITLSGYDSSSPEEVTPLNTLLSFTAFSYNMDSTNGSDATGGTCWGGATGLTGWNTATPLGAHITEVGIDYGRSISVAPSIPGVTVDAPCNLNNSNECAVHQDLGKGHVFAFTDEWVTYTSQWLATPPCIPATCTTTPAMAFQVPQFWYNAIKYASSSVTCFKINNPSVVY